ncbi:MAG: GatB/YqeY domain-containing protein, partial [Methanomicrobiales archaeon]|nr:GatB/YqeY domain-containing protein [Methanomicrobiales archaeon]
LATCRELARDGVAIDRVSEDEILALLSAVEAGRAAKEAIPDLLTELARTAGEGTGRPQERVDAAIEKVAPTVSQADVEAIVRRIVTEREAFARERGMGALGPLMGVVMQELRGSVDGRVISETLRRELKRLLT